MSYIASHLPASCYLVDHCAYGWVLVHDDLAYECLVRQLLGAQVEVRDVANRLKRGGHLHTLRQQLLQVQKARARLTEL
jgi:hypothetical protein